MVSLTFVYTCVYLSTDNRYKCTKNIISYKLGSILQIRSGTAGVVIQTSFQVWSYKHPSRCGHTNILPGVVIQTSFQVWSCKHPSRCGHANILPGVVIQTSFQVWSYKHPSRCGHTNILPGVVIQTSFQVWSYKHPSRCGHTNILPGVVKHPSRYKHPSRCGHANILPCAYILTFNSYLYGSRQIAYMCLSHKASYNKYMDEFQHRSCCRNIQKLDQLVWVYHFC